MPKVDEQISYNWLFFLLAGAFAAVTLWAVYDETYTRREWKVYQEEFFKIERALADAKLKAETEARDKSPKYKALVDEKQKIEADLKGPKKGAYEAAQARMQKAKEAAFDLNQTYTFTKSELDEVYYYFTLAKHSGNEKDRKDWGDKLDNYEARLRKDGEARDKADAELVAATAAVDAFTKRIGEIDKELELVDKERAEAERKAAGAKERSTEIIQQNLTEIGRVDRCESCHLGASRGGFEKLPAAQKHYQSHPFRRTLLRLHPVEKFGCTTCHDGQGRATQKFYAHAPSKNESPHAFHTHYWEEPLLHGAFMQANCTKCHLEQAELRARLECAIDAECPDKMKCQVPTYPPPDPTVPEPKDPPKYCVDTQSGAAPLVSLAPVLTKGRKIIEETGCFGCHPLAGYERLPKPGPDLRHVKAKLNPAWMVEWIRHPQAIRPRTRMPNFWPEPLRPEEHPFPVTEELKKKRVEEPKAIAAYLLSISTPFEPAKMAAQGDAARGVDLVTSLGCLACHRITGVKGPFADKLAKQVEDKNRGSRLDFGPDLGNVGDKTTAAWIYDWVRNPKHYAPEARMPSLRLTDQEAADVATFLAGLRSDHKYEEVDLSNPALIEQGKQAMTYYGCFGCHLIGGYENAAQIGVDLSDFGAKAEDRLDFGDYITDHNRQSWEAWTYHKLKHPRVYRYERVDTRMPQFELTDDEIQAVMVVLRGMRGAQLDAQRLAQKLTPMEQLRERGRQLVRWNNCYGCHTVDDHEGDIRQLYADKSLAPPLLTSQGFKTQPPWLFGFLKNVELLRPWLKVRMPTFGFSDEHATQLVAMFSALDNQPYPFRYYGDIKLEGADHTLAEAMFVQFKCQSCHVVNNDPLPPERVANAAPNLSLTRHRIRGDFIVEWLKNPDAHMRDTRMPSFWAGGTNTLEAIMGTDEGKARFGGVPGIQELVKAGPVAQMKLLADYLMTFGQGGSSGGAAKVAGKPAKAPKGKKAEAPPRKRAATATPASF